MLRNLNYTFLNVFGLSIGIAASVFIFLWILDESSYDTFNENYENIYRLVQDQNYEDHTFKVAATGAPMGFAFKTEFPEILESARFRPLVTELLVKTEDKWYYDSGVAYADTTFLNIFTVEFLQGSKEALYDPGTCIITESTASKIFGKEDAVGKSLTVNNTITLRVGAVIKDIPLHSHYTFNILINISDAFQRGWSTSWYNNSYYTYLVLNENSDYTQMESKFKKYLEDMRDGEEITTDFYLQPLKDVRLKSDFDIDLYSHSEPKVQYIFFFATIGIFILLICTINYMNLATARYIRRSREVGLRKVCGSSRWNVSRQFLIESFIITLISYLLGLLIVELTIPFFNDFSGKNLNITYSNPKLAIGLIMVFLATALLSGSYPAIALSSFKPISILQGRFKVRSENFRKALVIIQFSLGSILIGGTYIVYKQLDFINNYDLGLKKEQIIYAPFRGDVYNASVYKRFKALLLDLNSVQNVTYSSALPTYTVHSAGGFNWEGKNNDEDYIIHIEEIDHDFIETMGIEMSEGRNFDVRRGADSSRVLINEAAVKMMNMEEPIGKRIYHYGDTMEICGVMKDFNFKSLHKRVEPIRYSLDANPNGFILISISNMALLQESIKEVEAVWNLVNPDFPFSFSFLDEDYNELYELERKTGTLFILFGIIALFLASIGLFGLTAYYTEQKNKEIAIRKANGASAFEIGRYLVNHFTKLVLIANLIGIPLAFFALNNWLNRFAFHIDLNITYFILPLLLTLLISLIAQIFEIMKASRKNPVVFLKND